MIGDAKSKINLMLIEQVIQNGCRLFNRFYLNIRKSRKS